MLKQYFTDGLVQIAIVLSLLRTDLNDYLHHDFVNYPEVQEIILGPNVAYTQTNPFRNNIHNSIYGSHEVHKGIIDIDTVFTSSVFRDLRSLRHISNVRNIHIPTYLIVGGSSGNRAIDSNTDDEDENEDNINNNSGNNEQSTLEDLEAEGQSLLNTLEQSIEAISPLYQNFQGSDPTVEV